MDDRVSVIIPVYNVEPYIDECISSIRSQVFRDIEIVIVDDGSEDETLKKCKEHEAQDNRIRLIHQDNKGVVSARQAGIETASGKYITFVDGDDWIAPEAIQVMVDAIGDADLVSVGVNNEVHGDYFVRMRDSLETGTYEGEALRDVYGHLVYDLANNMTHPITTWIWNKLYVTEKVRKIHQTLNPKLTFSEDAVFVYRYILGCKKIVCLDSYLYYYRYREESALHRIDNHRLGKINDVYAEFLETFKDQPEEYRFSEQVYRWLIERCYIALNERMGLGREERIIRYLIDCTNLRDKKIVIYGAGRVGKDIYFQLKKLNYNIALWIDKRSETLRAEGWDVSPIETIKDVEYDVIIIAVENESARNSMMKDLLMLGVSQEWILDNHIIGLF